MKKILSLLFAVGSLMVFTVCAHADFGDYGGDYDYGGYDDYDYDYDDDDDDYYYDYDDDDDDYHHETVTKYYSLSGYPSGSDGYSGTPQYYNTSGQCINAVPLSKNSFSEADDDSASALGGLLIVVIIALVIFVRKRKKNGGGPSVFGSTEKSSPARSYQPRPAGAMPTEKNKLSPIGTYLTEDPGFSEAQFAEKLSNLYVRLQNAWQDKDLTVLRPYLSDAFYASSDRQLDNYRRNGQTNRIERIAVLDVKVNGWMRQGDEDIMIAALRTRITDYVTDDKTGQIVRGSRTQEKFMEYEWTLSRKSGIKTGAENEPKVINCPNCGAPLNINKTAKCAYCDSIVTVDATDWVLTGIRGIAQKTIGK